MCNDTHAVVFIASRSVRGFVGELIVGHDPRGKGAGEAARA